MNTKNLLIVSCLSLCMTLLTGCDPKGNYARNRLWLLLQYNPDMTAEALLDSLEEYNSVVSDFDVHLPATDADTRPHTDGRYVNPKTGSSLQFVLSDTVDAPYGIGTVSIRQQSYNELTFYDNDSTYVESVHAWGKGIYTTYKFVFKTDNKGNAGYERTHECYLMFVYPGGDSILTTQGYKASENVFRYKK